MIIENGTVRPTDKESTLRLATSSQHQKKQRIIYLKSKRDRASFETKAVITLKAQRKQRNEEVYISQSHRLVLLANR